MENQESVQKLRSFCETRWVERHDSIIFCNMYPAIISFLHRCIDLDANTATKARMLLTACSCPDFIVAISTLGNVGHYEASIRVAAKGRN